MQRRRVVVTGMGTVNPLAHNVKDTWDAIKSGKSGIGPITSFDTSDFKAKIAGEVKNFDPKEWMEKKEIRKMARFSRFAIAGAAQALEDAKLEKGLSHPERVGVILGNGIGGYEIMEEGMRQLVQNGPRGVPPMTIPMLINNEGPANVAIKWGFEGPCYALVTACSSGTDAIGAALNAIRYSQIDIAVTGGMEASITPFCIAGFQKLTALSTQYNDNATEASRPFDKDRDGFILGEGAGVLVLEELQHALKRGAPIYGEVAGYGMSCDAYHLTRPDTEGTGATRSMSWALQDAGMEPHEIDYINAHGTSTQTNDPLETMAIKKAFGKHAYNLAVSSTKSMTAHLIGGTGGLEAIISLLAIRDGFLPPTINLHHTGEGCDLDYVPLVGRKANVKAVLSDNLGFGGHNGSVIFRKFEE